MKKILAVSIVIAAVAVFATSINFASSGDSARVTDNLPAAKAPNIAGGMVRSVEYGNKWDGSVAANNSTQSAFSVPGGFGYVKMWFHNKDSKSVTITLRHESGKEYYSKTLLGNSQDIWYSATDYPQGVRAGKYTVQFHSSEGAVDVQYNGFATDKP
ncbi:hypothetical protein ACFQ3W_01245 [Paenibacillus puldeungensis]|uniref:Uncharacterized protein n=1 Tax=Paenibacillus puldeungensis TaxID=696536 RepID=A0ABW3RRL9_9BACL